MNKSIEHILARTAKRKAAGLIPDYAARPAPAPAAPCVYEGAAVPRTSAKRWHRCEHPQRVALGLAEVACPCTGCGRGCRGYVAEE